MVKLKALFRNRNFIFLLATVSGLLTDKAAPWTEPLILPGLAVVMTVSTMSIPNRAFRSARTMLMPAFLGSVMSYLVLSGVILILTRLMIQEPSLRAGYVLIAAVPPAVAVIPFTGILKGNESFTLFSTIGAYLVALMILPLMAFFFLSIKSIDPMRLMVITGELILLPILISRVLLFKGWHKPIAPFKGPITDWSFFLIIYTIVGLNRQIIMGNPTLILPVATIAFLSIFVLGYLIDTAGRLLRVERKTLISLTLLGTLKNYGLSGGLSLIFFSKEASLPSAVCSIFLIFFIIWMDYRQKRRKPAIV
jgi:bile acid:Na+ symporter, BASS family